MLVFEVGVGKIVEVGDLVDRFLHDSFLLVVNDPENELDDMRKVEGCLEDVVLFGP